MTQTCTRFLTKQLSKGGQNAYVALLLLGAAEKNEKDLLKRFNVTCIRQNLAAR